VTNCGRGVSSPYRRQPGAQPHYNYADLFLGERRDEQSCQRNPSNGRGDRRRLRRRRLRRRRRSSGVLELQPGDDRLTSRRAPGWNETPTGVLDEKVPSWRRAIRCPNSLQSNELFVFVWSNSYWRLTVFHSGFKHCLSFIFSSLFYPLQIQRYRRWKWRV